MQVASLSAYGNANGGGVGTTLDFIGPTVVVTVATGQRVFVTANKALGSTVVGGANGLNLYICYQSTVSGSVVTPHGAGSFGYTVDQNQRASFGLNDVVTGIVAGSYNVGLCGSSPSAANWNSNEYGYVSAMVMN